MKTWHFAIAGAVVGVSVLVSAFVLSGTAYAGGGVGSGGGGSGGSGGTGNWTWYGWGWSIYPTSGPGPTDGFHNGASWASIQSMCASAGAQQVYANIVDDSAGHGMVYDYFTYETVPYVYAGNFAPGASVDGGRAIATSTAQANAAFNTLGSYGVNTAGYTFGVNVGWFCYDYNPPPQPVTIQGRIFDWQTGAPAQNGTDVFTCVSPSANTSGIDAAGNAHVSSNGFYSFTVPKGTGFCLRVNYTTWIPYQVINDPGLPVNIPSPVYARPWAVDGGAWSGDQYGNCPARIGVTNPDYCQYQTYECQIAGGGYENTCGINNRADSNGYDFVYDLPPAGNIDASSCTNPSVQGWAFDPDDSSASIYVDVYAVGPGPGLPGYGAPGGTGTGVGRFTANGWRPDVDSYFRIGGNHGFQINLSQYDGYAPRTFYLYAIDITGYGSPGPVNQYIGQVTIGGCATPTCQPPTVPGDGNVPEPNSSFSVTATATWSPYGASGTPPGGQNALPALTLSSSPGATITPTGPQTDTYSGGTMTETQAFNVVAPVAGMYTFTEHIAGLSCGTNNSVTQNVDNKPYLKIYGGDTMAGSGFAGATGTDSCADPNAKANLNAGAYAWNTGSGSYAGSSTNIGSFAAYLVDGYASGNGTGTSPPRSLTFANTSGGTYGGNFGDATCVPDYYNELQSSGYVRNHSTTITSYPSGPDRAVYLYSGTDVSITGNVAMPTSGWTGPSDIPLFYVVVKGGNIYIDKQVSELDGVYIAEPDSSGNGGNIYTCANGASRSVPNDPFSLNPSGCSQPLTVKGSLIAKDIHFLRTRGTVDQSTAGSANCTAPDPHAAETICYLPSLWLANPFPAGSSELDNISSLPPVL